MSFRLPRKVRCASCDAESEVDSKLPEKPVPRNERGLDGNRFMRPEFQLCSACGHLAPELSMIYPGLARAKAIRDELLAASEHTKLASQCRAIAALFEGTEPRAEGTWLLEAAWADEARGNVEGGRRQRRRAAELLETSLWTGRALSAARGASACLLAECFRVAGDAGSAREHAVRGLRGALRDVETRGWLLFELAAIASNDDAPRSRGHAEATVLAMTPEARRALAKAADLAVPRGSPELAPSPDVPLASLEQALVERATFAADYLDADTFDALLRRDDRRSLASAIAERDDARRFLELLDDASIALRKPGLAAFRAAAFPRDGQVWEGEGLRALLVDLGDEDAALASAAGLVLSRLVPRCSPSQRALVVEAASRALAKTGSEASLESVLERLVTLATAPG